MTIHKASRKKRGFIFFFRENNSSFNEIKYTLISVKEIKNGY